MINITKHVLKRYVERIKNVEEDLIDETIKENKEQYETELNEMFEQSNHVYDGKFNDKFVETSFWIVDDVVLVTDTETTKLITLYKVDYGFTKEINNNILSDLLRDFEVSKNIYFEMQDVVGKEKEVLLSNRDVLDLKIESLEETLKAMKESRESLDNYIRKFSYEEKKAELEMDTIAQKIVYSVNYRIETLKI